MNSGARRLEPSRRPALVVSALLALLALVAVAAFPRPADAATAPGVWQCRASALNLSIGGQPGVEPIVANGNRGSLPGKVFDRPNCVSETSGAGDLSGSLGLNGLIGADATKAVTSITPETGAPKAQKVTASTDSANVRLNIPGVPDALSIDAVRTNASAQCTNGKPTFDGSSTLTDIKLGGVPISLDDLVTQLSAALKPLGFLVQITPNNVVKDGDSVVVQALRVRLLPSSGENGGLIDLVLGESKIHANGDVCNNDGDITPNPPEDGICPPGSKAFPGTPVLCIIPGTDRYGVVVIGTPNGAPSGGTVIPLVEARRLAAEGKLPNSKCLYGPGLDYVIVGTDGADKIIGTTGDDRILALGGNDKAYGVDGRDCVDGGPGNDKLYGGADADRVYGGTGNDRIIGGYGNDRLFGGPGRDVIDGGGGDDKLYGESGNDSLNGNSGNDRLSTGSGRDSAQSGSSGKKGGSDRVFTSKHGRAVVNVAVGTHPTKVYCHSKRDMVRANRDEIRKKTIKGCKRVLQTKTVVLHGKRIRLKQVHRRR